MVHGHVGLNPVMPPAQKRRAGAEDGTSLPHPIKHEESELTASVLRQDQGPEMPVYPLHLEKAPNSTHSTWKRHRTPELVNLRFNCRPAGYQRSDDRGAMADNHEDASLRRRGTTQDLPSGWLAEETGAQVMLAVGGKVLLMLMDLLLGEQASWPTIGRALQFCFGRRVLADDAGKQARCLPPE